MSVAYIDFFVYLAVGLVFSYFLNPMKSTSDRMVTQTEIRSIIKEKTILITNHVIFASLI